MVDFCCSKIDSKLIQKRPRGVHANLQSRARTTLSHTNLPSPHTPPGPCYMSYMCYMVLTLCEDVHNAKRDINEALMERAAERVGSWGGHAIIAGDLNVPPRTNLWHFLSARGWVEAHQHAGGAGHTYDAYLQKEQERHNFLFAITCSCNS